MTALALVKPVPSIEGKPPAHDPGAEAATLTACMLKPECAAQAMSIAAPDDFYWASHRAIAQAIVDLLEKGDETHATNVSVRLREKGTMGVVGGDGDLVAMMDQVPAVAGQISKYAGKVRDLAQVRRLAEAMHRLLAECYLPIDDVGAFLSRADTVVGDVTRVARGGSISSALEVTKDVARAISATPTARITTGFSSLDKVANGFEPSALYVLAARTGMGKTALAMQMVVGAAEAGHRVLVVSLEMPRQQLMRRMVCGRAKVAVKAVKDRSMTPNQWSQFALASSEIAQLPIHFSDAPSQTILDIKAACRVHKPELLVVDHIGLMRPSATSSGAKRSREQEVAEFSRGLKALALESKMPVLALCQVNREVAKGARRPVVSDLRESGSIEQDADGIWLIHRPGYYDPKASPEMRREAELVVAKQRDGATGVLPLVWEAPEFYVPSMNDGTEAWGA